MPRTLAILLFVSTGCAIGDGAPHGLEARGLAWTVRGPYRPDGISFPALSPELQELIDDAEPREMTVSVVSTTDDDHVRSYAPEREGTPPREGRLTHCRSTLRLRL